MVSYRFDLYPRDDPRDGTLIRSFTSLQKAAYRAEANGTSTGQIAVRSTTDDGQAIDPRGLDYVRVTELPGGSVRGGFFLEKGKFQALSEDEDSLLTFSGAGTLAYLDRAAMAPHTYLDTAIGTDPYDDTWRWGDQGPAAGGDFIGAALWRTVYEAQHFRVPGTQHRHVDGEIYTDSHDDDRTESAIPDVVMTFDQFEDSSGNPWTIPSGDLKSQVGESVLSVVKRLMEAGLYVELDPDTFELSAWEQDVHRAMLDATGSTWATDKVRFQSPTDPDDITTGNIKDDAVRNIEAYIKRSALWAGGNDVYGLATSPGDIPWEGHYRADVEDVDALEAIAAAQLQAISEAGDTLKLQLWMDDDPVNGRYLPFQHVKLDQLVTVHTGTDQWEFDERTFPVAAITVELRQGGNWQAIVELGASYSASASRQFQVRGAPAHSHTLPFCGIGTPGTPGTGNSELVYRSWNYINGDNTSDQNDHPWGHYQATDLADCPGLTAPYGRATGTTTAYFSGRMACVPGGTITITGKIARVWFTDNPIDTKRYRIKFYTATVGGSELSTEVLNPGSFSRSVPANFSFSVVAPAGANGFQVGFQDNTAHDEVEITSYDTDGTPGTPGTSGDLPLDTVLQGNERTGTVKKISRCDHQHAHGLLSDDGVHYHDFSQISGDAGDDLDHGSLPGLTDDDHPQYALIVNTDSDPGRTIYVGSVDPTVSHSPATGDVWIEVP